MYTKYRGGTWQYLGKGEDSSYTVNISSLTNYSELLIIVGRDAQLNSTKMAIGTLIVPKAVVDAGQQFSVSYIDTISSNSRRVIVNVSSSQISTKNTTYTQYQGAIAVYYR